MRIPGEPLVQAGGQGALGGQVIFQRQDPSRGSQRVALVEQLPDPGGQGQLAAGIAAAAATCPLRGDRARGVQGAQECLLDAQNLGSPAGGIGRVIRVVKVIEPGGHRGAPPDPGRGSVPATALDSLLQSALYKKCIGH
jgi:hypothetical protein